MHVLGRCYPANPKIALLALTVVTGPLLAPPLHAASGSDSTDALLKLIAEQNRKIDELSEKVRSLEDREKVRETTSTNQSLPAIIIDTNGVPVGGSAAVAVASTNKAPDQISIGTNGFGYISSDGDYSINLHGVLQIDSRTFFDDNPLAEGNKGFLVRRARPILDGTLFRDFGFAIVPDFGASSVQLFDAFIEYRPSPAFQFRIGKFKGPVGLEMLQSDASALYVEKSLASDLVPMRNLGLQISGTLDAGTVSWAAGFFNQDGDYRVAGNTPFSNGLEFAGRLFLEPFRATDLKPLKGLGFGVGGSFSEISSNSAALPSTSGGNLPGYVTPGQQQFFAYNPLFGSVVADGPHWRLSPQGYYYCGPFGLQAEYIFSEQEVLNSATMRRVTLDHTGWQVSAQWVLTGEPASFNGIIPAHPFSISSGGWGAWQLTAGYSQLTLGESTFNGFSNPLISARGANSWSVGLNWWLNRNIRVSTAFSQTSFQGGGQINPNDPNTLTAPATVSHQNESVLFTRVQVAF